VAHHGTVAVVDLALLPGRRLDHRVRLDDPLAAQLHHEATHALVAVPEAVIVDQVLPDRHRVATLFHAALEQLAVGLARTGGRAATGSRRRPGVGDHLYGRIWIRAAPAARATHRHARRLQVPARRLTAHPGGFLDLAQAPAQSPKCKDLLLFLSVQDVCHGGRG
jgi:hypothetical protein